MKRNDLEEIKAPPESTEYFIMLILQRHLANFYFEIEGYNEHDKSYFETLKKLLDNPDLKVEDLKGSFNDIWKNKTKHFANLIEQSKKEESDEE